MKQSYDYDCGHVCLRDQGFTPPDKQAMLTVLDICGAIGKTPAESRYFSGRQFTKNGIYMIVGRSYKTLEQLLLDPDLSRHWVSYRNGVVLEPTRGKTMSVNEFNKWLQEINHENFLFVDCE